VRWFTEKEVEELNQLELEVRVERKVGEVE
jgi:hypothetical protein